MMLNDRNVKGIGSVYNDDRSILLNKSSQRLNAESNLCRAKQVSCNPNPSLFYFVFFAPQIHPEIKRTLFALRCWQSLTLATQVVNFEQKETFLPFSSLVKFYCIASTVLSCMGWSRLQNWFFKKVFADLLSPLSKVSPNFAQFVTIWRLCLESWNFLHFSAASRAVPNKYCHWPQTSRTLGWSDSQTFWLETISRLKQKAFPRKTNKTKYHKPCH